MVADGYSTLQYVRRIYGGHARNPQVKVYAAALIALKCATFAILAYYGGIFGAMAYLFCLPLYFAGFHWLLRNRGLIAPSQEQ